MDSSAEPDDKRAKLGLIDVRRNVMYSVKYIHSQRMSPDEYNSLRAEAIKRIELITTQASTALSASIATWVIAISIMAASFSDAFQLDENVIEVLCVAQGIIIMVVDLFLTPIAIKSGENMNQIVSLSCYIRLYYEAEVNRDCLFSWERALNSFSVFSTNRGVRSKIRMTLINAEYGILAVSSFLLNVGLYAVYYFKLPSMKENMCIVGICGLIFVIEAVLAFFIPWASSAENNMGRIIPKIMHGYIEYGLTHGLITARIESETGEAIPMVSKNIAVITDAIARFLLDYHPRDYDIYEWEFQKKCDICSYRKNAFLKWTMPLIIISAIIFSNWKGIMQFVCCGAKFLSQFIIDIIRGRINSVGIGAFSVVLLCAIAFYGHLAVREKRHKLNTIVFYEDTLTRQEAEEEIGRRNSFPYILLFRNKYQCSENVTYCDVSNGKYTDAFKHERFAQAIVSINDSDMRKKVIEECEMNDMFVEIAGKIKKST